MTRPFGPRSSWGKKSFLKRGWGGKWLTLVPISLWLPTPVVWLKTLSKGVKTHLSKSKTFGFWNFFLICYKLLWKSNILNPIFKKFSRGATHPRTPRKWLGPSGLAEVWEKRAFWRGAGGKWLTLVSISLRLPYPCTLVQNSFKRRKNASFKVKYSRKKNCSEKASF